MLYNTQPQALVWRWFIDLLVIRTSIWTLYIASTPDEGTHTFSIQGVSEKFRDLCVPQKIYCILTQTKNYQRWAFRQYWQSVTDGCLFCLFWMMGKLTKHRRKGGLFPSPELFTSWGQTDVHSLPLTDTHFIENRLNHTPCVLRVLLWGWTYTGANMIDKGIISFLYFQVPRSLLHMFTCYHFSPGIPLRREEVEMF